jgi:hypothetical protein
MAAAQPRHDGGAAPEGARAGAHASLATLAATIGRSARDVVAHVAEIAALESRLAGTTLAIMAGAAVAVVVLVLSAWGLLLAAAVYGLVAAGMSAPAALLVATALTLLLAGVLLWIILRLVPRLKFAATRRALARVRSAP